MFFVFAPDPIDTSDVVLSDDMLALTEELARNTHNVWAKGRRQEGWTFGLKRNDEKKETPLLIHYDYLADSEKEYDRNTALETLKLIIKLGYKITKDE